MKLIILCMLTGFLSKAQNTDIRGNQYFLKGKIIKKSDAIIQACGSDAWALVVELEIINFTNDSYKGKNIPVIFTCPTSYRKQYFNVGKVHTLKVADQKQTNFAWIISNYEALEKYNLKTKFWVIN
ncbi:hypothetical protein [uncultured Kordia sp.]|uniref:hypothetical protein n=1 Tax=uncultured Kordia sp. TaxID=507699 RepID=UPI002636E22F|nr:hypothetical protein [uncultured Kordia sp.]